MTSSNEEKIRELVKDEEKVEAFIDDEEFMNKIVGGNAEPKDYANKLKGFGIDISEKGAKGVQETVNKMLCKPVEEMGDDVLKNISGGSSVDAAEIALNVTGAAGVGVSLAGLGCLVASKIYECKDMCSSNSFEHMTAIMYGGPGYFRARRQKPDYTKRARVLKKVGLSLIGGGGAAVTAFGVGHLINGKKKD